MAAATLRVLGCGDAFGSGGRLQTCFFVAAGAQGLLIDCGATALSGMHRFGVDPARVDAILLSHLHGDHFGGIPFFLLHAQHAAKRARPLTIAGPAGVQARIEAALDLLFPGATDRRWRFPLEFVELSPQAPATVGSAAVRCFPVEHPSGAPALGLRLEVGGRSIAYSGDTQWTETLVALADGADLFICECFAYDEPLGAHLSYRQLVARRADLRAKRILLTHMGATMLERLPEIELETTEDGMLIEL